MAEQEWKTNRGVFAAVSLPTLLWVLLFFLIPMAIVWLYSFGENRGLTEIAISGTLDNYKRATEWLYLSIFGKSFAVAALVTLICLIVGFPVAMAITFASEKWRPWLLLGIMLPFWTNLLVRVYAWILLLRNGGLVDSGLHGLGLTDKALGILYTDGAVIIGLLYTFLPFMVLPLYANLVNTL